MAKRHHKSEKFNHDKISIHPRNHKQQELMEFIDEKQLTFAIGYPGTAKTLWSIYKAIEMFDDHNSPINKIVVTRNNCDAEGSKSIGSLPGTLEEKTDIFLNPIYDNLQVFMSPGRIKYVQNNATIEFIPYEYILGRSLQNTFLIIEEAQNCTSTQLYKMLTRIGSNGKIVVNGDYMTQRDLPSKYGRCGLEDALHKLSKLDSVGVVNFDSIDYVEREGIVRDIILAYFG